MNNDEKIAVLKKLLIRYEAILHSMRCLNLYDIKRAELVVRVTNLKRYIKELKSQQKNTHD